MSTVANFFAPSDLSGISGTKCEHIYAINRWRNSPGHFDTLFVNAAPGDMDDDDDDDDSSAHMIQGLEIAPAHLVFSFTLDGVKYPCMLVLWFSQMTDMLSDVTGMYAMEPECLPNSQPLTAIILQGSASPTCFFKSSSTVKTSTIQVDSWLVLTVLCQ